MRMDCNEVIRFFEENRNEKNRKGMERFGITTDKAYGISIPVLRAFAKTIKKDHALAGQLWKTGLHEARLLAAFIADPKQVTEKEMDKWVKDLDSWDICDQACSNLWDKTPFVYGKINEWCAHKEEFIKRAGFVLIATSAVHHKSVDDSVFIKFLSLIEQYATDDRNFVKKAVNWALRQVGKRSKACHSPAVKCAERLAGSENAAARWIGKDALRELNGEIVMHKVTTGSYRRKVDK